VFRVRLGRELGQRHVGVLLGGRVLPLARRFLLALPSLFPALGLRLFGRLSPLPPVLFLGGLPSLCFETLLLTALPRRILWRMATCRASRGAGNGGGPC